MVRDIYVADDTVVNDKIAYIHKTDGMRRMIFMEPRNLASVNDRDATLIKVYNENGELVGKIDPSRAEPVLDDHQLWLQELPPGETGYDGNGQPLVSRTKPGDISFAPAQPTDESSDLSSVSLNWNGTVIPLRDANSRLLNGPEMGAFDASTIYDKVTGQASPIPFVFDDEFLKSPDHLAQRLLQLQEAHQLPGLMTVNVGNPLFGHADSDWHTINVYNYDPESALVRYSNQWSAVDDRMANGVPLSDLFQAMQPVVADQSIVGDASGAPAIRPLPKPYWLRAALRQQRLEAQAESWR
jgi:hypothetical protein